MTVQGMTLKERRAASDARIIESAIKSFGENGYTHSTMIDIAKGAGVTGGLIAQRFVTKEQLFETAYDHAVLKTNIQLGLLEQGTAREYLIAAVKDIKRIRIEYPSEFRFLKTILNSTDFPTERLRKYIEKYKTTSGYEILHDAQRQGMLPTGDLEMLIFSFYILVMNQVDICITYQLDMPDDDYFLGTIRFVDLEKEKRRQKNEKMLSALVDSFEVFAYIWIDTNEAEQVSNFDESSRPVDWKDARGTIERQISNLVCDEDQPKIRDFLNLDTLSERIQNHKVLTCTCTEKDGKVVNHYLFPLSRDASGRVTEILAGVQKINAGGEAKEVGE